MKWVAVLALLLAASVALATSEIIHHEDGSRTVVTCGGVPPMLEHQVTPVVPDSLWSALQDTAILLYITISDSGAVVSAEYLAGEKLLHESAAAAVLQWRYSPAMRGTEAVEVRISLPLALHPSRGDGVLEWSGSAMRRFIEQMNK